MPVLPHKKPLCGQLYMLHFKLYKKEKQVCETGTLVLNIGLEVVLNVKLFKRCIF
jgi:hypothetical protein